MSETIYYDGGVKTRNWGTGKMNIAQRCPERECGSMLFLPTELHLKEDGANDGTAAFVIVMDYLKEDMKPLQSAHGVASFNMLAAAFKELGYKLEKI